MKGNGIKEREEGIWERKCVLRKYATLSCKADAGHVFLVYSEKGGAGK